MSLRSHRRKRSSQKSKSVATTEQLVLNRLMVFVFLVAAILLAAYLTMVASRR